MRYPTTNDTVHYASIPRKYSIRIRERDLPLGEMGEPMYDGIHFDKRLLVAEVEKSANGLTKLEHAADGALDSKAGSSESDISSSSFSSSASTIGSANGEVHLNPYSDWWFSKESSDEEVSVDEADKVDGLGLEAASYDGSASSSRSCSWCGSRLATFHPSVLAPERKNLEEADSCEPSGL